MKGNELNQNLEVSPRDTFNVPFCGWRKAGRRADAALAGSAAKKGARDGGRAKGRTEKPPSGAKTAESTGSRSPREPPRLEADRKRRLLRTPHSRQPGLGRQEGRRGWRRGRWYQSSERAQPSPPDDWPCSGVGVGSGGWG